MKDFGNDAHSTHDFDLIDLRSAAQVEVIRDLTGKVWINLNGKCLLRLGYTDELIYQDLFVNKVI